MLFKSNLLVINSSVSKLKSLLNSFNLLQLLVFFALFSINICFVNAATYNSITGKGNWQSTSGWIDNVIPPDANGVIAVIDGSITSTTGLTFNNNITIRVLTNDTLIILGNLALNNNAIIEVQTGGVLLVRGNFTCNNNMNLDANSYLIVTGSLNIKNNNELTSATSPSKVFIGNGYTTGNGTGGNVLNCPTGGTNYHTDCNYGDFVDVMNDPISNWLMGISCTSMPIWNTRPDVNPNPAITTNTLNFVAGASTTIVSYAWSGPVNFMYSGTSGNTSRGALTTSMSGFYKISALNSVGCILRDSIYVLITDPADCGAGFNSGYFSRNNYSGNWESASSWEVADPYIPAPPPSTGNAGQNVLIKGRITINGDYSPQGSNQLICDTLIITGNLNLENPTLTVASTGVLIVLGNINVTGSSGGTIFNDFGRIVVGGVANLPWNYTYTQNGTETQGAIYPLGGLNSPQPEADVNDHDLAYMMANDNSLYTFYTNVVCGGGVTAGTISGPSSVCSGDEVALTGTSASPSSATYQWYYSIVSASGPWNAGGTGQNYDPEPDPAVTTWFYRRAQAGAGCTASSNVLTITVNERPVTNSIAHN